MAEPIRARYGDEWLPVYHETIGLLQQIYGTQNDLFLMAGPGSAAIDAALGSLMRTGEKVLVASNGFFGQRLGAIAQGYGLDVRLVEASQGQPVDPEAVRQTLVTSPTSRPSAWSTWRHRPGCSTRCARSRRRPMSVAW